MGKILSSITLPYRIAGSMLVLAICFFWIKANVYLPLKNYDKVVVENKALQKVVKNQLKILGDSSVVISDLKVDIGAKNDIIGQLQRQCQKCSKEYQPIINDLEAKIELLVRDCGCPECPKCIFGVKKRR